MSQVSVSSSFGYSLQKRSALDDARPVSRMPAPWSLGWLALATLLLTVSNGHWVLPLAAWVAPVFFVRFLRMQRLFVGLVLADLAFTSASFVNWWGMAPFEGVLYFLVVAALSQGLFLVFVIDRLVAPRLRGFAATLVLPTAWVTIEYLAAIASPYGTWGATAYTQFGHIALWQLLSVTGTPGIAFLVGWFASMVNFAWENGFDSARTRVGLAVYAAVLGSVILVGEARITFFPPTAETVRVASITAPDQLRDRADSMKLPTAQQLTDELWEALRANCRALQEYLVERTRHEAAAGAKIVFWPEAHATVAKQDESQLIELGRQVARESGIYLGMGLWVQHRTDQTPNFENRFVFIDPTGEVLFDYTKQIPVPGWEATSSIIAVRDFRLPVVETRYGRIAAAICFDMDFPWFIRQAGQAGADLILSPGSDWRAVDPLHTYMVCARGVEVGASVVRQTNAGLSMAVDPQGRVLAQMDHFTTPGDQRVMISHVPVRGVRTPYAQVGDMFAWCAVVGLLGLAVLGGRSKKFLMVSPGGYEGHVPKPYRS